MIISAFKSSLQLGSMTPLIAAIIASLFLVFCVIPIHEWAHAVAAYKMGDPTPKLAGGLTLNPLAHIDPVGGILIALIGFGWGKPTPINPNNFKNRKLGVAVSAAAGPLANIICGFLIYILQAIVLHVPALYNTVLQQILYYVLEYAAQISIYLAVLNLLPVPPFDGYSIIEGLLPSNAVYWIKSHMQIISIVIIVLLFTNVLTTPIAWVSNFVITLLKNVANLPFG